MKYLSLLVCVFLAITLPARAESYGQGNKSLLGTWYEHGDKTRPCSIAEKGKVLMAQDHDGNKSPLIVKSSGLIYATTWVQYAEVFQDRLLWSKGNWWSRKPVSYR